MSRTDRLARLYAGTLARMRAARDAGDMAGYHYLQADARRLARALAEG